MKKLIIILIIFFSTNIYALNLTIYCKGEEIIFFEPHSETGEWVKTHRKNNSDYVFIVDDFYILFGSSKYPRKEEDSTYFWGSTMEITGVGTLNPLFSGESVRIDRINGDGYIEYHGFFAGKGKAEHIFNSCSTEKPEKPKLQKCAFLASSIRSIVFHRKS